MPNPVTLPIMSHMEPQFLDKQCGLMHIGLFLDSEDPGPVPALIMTGGRSLCKFHHLSVQLFDRGVIVLLS